MKKGQIMDKKESQNLLNSNQVIETPDIEATFTSGKSVDGEEVMADMFNKSRKTLATGTAKDILVLLNHLKLGYSPRSKLVYDLEKAISRLNYGQYIGLNALIEIRIDEMTEGVLDKQRFIDSLQQFERLGQVICKTTTLE